MDLYVILIINMASFFV